MVMMRSAGGGPARVTLRLRESRVHAFGPIVPPLLGQFLFCKGAGGGGINSTSLHLGCRSDDARRVVTCCTGCLEENQSRVISMPQRLD